MAVDLLVMELPIGWVQVQTGLDDPAAFVGALPARLAGDAAAVPTAWRALFDRLAGDLRDGSSAAPCSAWTAQTVVGDVSGDSGEARRVARPVVATFSVLVDAVTSVPVGETPLAPAQAVALPCGPATMTVAVVGVGADQLLEVTYLVAAAPDLALRLVGRSPNLTIVDALVRMFHLMAVRVGLPAIGQDAVVRA